MLASIPATHPASFLQDLCPIKSPSAPVNFPGWSLLLLLLIIHLFLGALDFLSLQQVEATIRCGAWASHHGGFSYGGAQSLGTWASVVVACGL